jgi:hypothetical protein
MQVKYFLPRTIILTLWVPTVQQFTPHYMNMWVQPAAGVTCDHRVTPCHAPRWRINPVIDGGGSVHSEIVGTVKVNDIPNSSTLARAQQLKVLLKESQQLLGRLKKTLMTNKLSWEETPRWFIVASVDSHRSHRISLYALEQLPPCWSRPALMYLLISPPHQFGPFYVQCCRRLGSPWISFTMLLDLVLCHHTLTLKTLA